MKIYPQRKNSTQMIYGLRPLIEAVHSGKEFEKIFIQQGLHGDLAQELLKLLKEINIPVQYVPIEKLNRITTANHQGAVGLISQISYYSLENIISELFEKGQTPLVLILDRITDVRNFGAIARTAECAGVHALVVPSRNSAQINEDAVKTSAGALHRIPICREENLKTCIHFLKSCGLQMIAATEKTKHKYTDLDFSLPTALLLGSEEDGVSPEYLKLCHGQAAIPMLGDIASLNVSVAAGILLYEALRQRNSVS